MDQALAAFREAAAHENRGRLGLQRRYSSALQQQAIEYWRHRRRAGDGTRAIAAALGVADWSLRRWIRATTTSPRFETVQVITPAAAHAVPRLVLRLTADGPRVEGLDVDMAAKLLGLLR